MKLFVAFSFLLISSHLLGQVGEWNPIKVDNNMEFSLPGKVLKIDTTLKKESGVQRMLVFKAATENSTLGLTVTPGPAYNEKANTPESAQKALKEVVDGFCKSASAANYSYKISDTTINNVPGKRALIKNDAQHVAFNNYIFILNNKLYMISHNETRTGSHESSVAEMAQFLRSVRFNTN